MKGTKQVRTKRKKHLYVEELEERRLLSSFYVAPMGNDSNNGSSASPWLTLQHAADSVQPGDMVNALPGNYTGFNITKSGTATAPITFTAQPGAVINHPYSWGGLLFGINASGPSNNIIQGFTIAPQASDPDWDQGIRMGGIFPGGAIPNWASGNVIRNNTVQMRVVPVGDQTSNHDQLGIFTSWQDGVQVNNNTVSGGWDSGIYISNSSKNYTVQGNTVFNVGGNGIHNNGDAGQGGPGINTNALIQNNIIHDVGFGIGGQAISCDGLQNSRIQNNLIYNTWSKGISLYVTNAAAGSINNIVVNNTVLTGMNGSTGVAMRITGASTGNTVTNNIFDNTVAGGWSYEVDAGPDVIDYNVVMSPPQAGANLQAWQSWGWDLHSIVATPAQLFVNPTAANYQLKAGSPAIGAGSATNAPVVDILGNPRPSGGSYDIGAYEYQTGIGVTAVTPATGVTTGGQSVTITGSNFTTVTGVFFGGVAASSFTVNSNTTITALSPAHAAGTVDITVANATGSSATSTADQFQYVTSISTAPPTVATPASASLTNNQTSATLSVLGSSQYGANTLIYTWVTTGTPPAPVAFSTNGANSASTVTAAFSKAGSYSFQVTITDPAGNSATSTVGVTVNQLATTLTVSPGNGVVAPNGTLQFSNTASDQFGKPYNQVTWTVSGGGTIDNTGKFAAGSVTGGPFTVTASAGSLNATSSVTVSTIINLGVNGTAYRWFGLSSATGTGNRTAAPGLNDNNLSADVALSGGGDDVANAYEAGGVLWSASQSVTRVTFTNGSFNASSYDGVFDNGFALQTTTDGTTWTTVTGWTVSPAYQYNLAAAGGVTYTFTGPALAALGVRVVGRVHSLGGNDSWYDNATEIQVFGPGSGTSTPTAPTNVSATGGVLQIVLTWTAGSNDASYNVYRSTTSGFAASSATLLGASSSTGFTDSTATPGTTYYYLVAGVSSSGQQSSTSNQVSAAAHAGTPAAPTSVTATGSVLQITLSWTAGSNDASYNVYRSTVSGFTPSSATLVGTVTSSSYTDNTVTAGSTYYYLVTGVNTTGQQSSSSGQASATAQAPAPAAPTGLTASGAVLQIVLSWTAGSNDASYNVYRSTVSGFTASSSTLLGSSTATGYTDPSATSGTTYYYLVTGVNSTGQQSSASNQVSAAAQAGTPAAPTNVTATGGVLQITLTWTAGSNDASYNVYRSTASGFAVSSSTLVGTVTSSSYTDSSVTAGSTYYYLVTGVNATGQQSPASSQVSATAQAAAPAAPTNLMATAGIGQIVLTWTTGSNDASYNVYRSTASGFAASSSTLVGTVTSSSYTDSSVTAGSTYYYLVTGVNGTGQESSASNEASAIDAPAAPGAPAGLTASGGVLQVALSWTAGSNDATYDIYRSTVSGFSASSSALLGTASSTGYTDSTATPGTTYYYVVTGVDATGQQSSASNQASAAAQAGLPSAPSGLTATGAPLTITLSWTAGSNDVSYKVYRSTVFGFTPSSATLVGATTGASYVDSSVTAGATYYYVVTGVNATGQESSASGQAGAMALAAMPAAPSNVTATGGVAQIMLTWTAGSNDASYYVYRSTATSFTASSSAPLATISTATYTDTTVTPGTTYYYVIVGLNSTGQQSAASNPASATGLAPLPGAPTNLTATGGTLQILLTWTTGSNDVSYNIYRSTVSGFAPSASTLLASSSGTTYTDSSVTAGTKYYYVVVGVSSSGQLSSSSNQVVAAAQAARRTRKTSTTLQAAALGGASFWLN